MGGQRRGVVFRRRRVFVFFLPVEKGRRASDAPRLRTPSGASFGDRPPAAARGSSAPRSSLPGTPWPRASRSRRPTPWPRSRGTRRRRRATRVGGRGLKTSDRADASAAAAPPARRALVVERDRARGRAIDGAAEEVLQRLEDLRRDELRRGDAGARGQRAARTFARKDASPRCRGGDGARHGGRARNSKRGARSRARGHASAPIAGRAERVDRRRSGRASRARVSFSSRRFSRRFSRRSPRLRGLRPRRAPRARQNARYAAVDAARATSGSRARRPAALTLDALGRDRGGARDECPERRLVERRPVSRPRARDPLGLRERRRSHVAATRRDRSEIAERASFRHRRFLAPPRRRRRRRVR